MVHLYSTFHAVNKRESNRRKQKREKKRIEANIHLRFVHYCVNNNFTIFRSIFIVVSKLDFLITFRNTYLSIKGKFS